MTKLHIADEHTHLIGHLAKITEFGVLLEKKYEDIFGFGNPHKASHVHYYCHIGNKYEMSLMFIDEPPIKRGNMTWFCLEEVGVGVNEDWHYFTLDQLIICN